MNKDHSVFVAHNDYGKSGFEAVVDLAHSRKEIVAYFRRPIPIRPKIISAIADMPLDMSSIADIRLAAFGGQESRSARERNFLPKSGNKFPVRPA